MASRPTRGKIDTRRFEFLCESGKVAYDTRDDALTGADTAMMADLVKPGCHLMPYECEDCGRWHVRNQRIILSTHVER